MSRYIDKDKLLDDLNWHAPGEYKAKVTGVITKQPEADVVEVVRCKDCKYCINSSCYMSNLKKGGTYLGTIHFTDKDDYCSYGERKENEQ